MFTSDDVLTNACRVLLSIGLAVLLFHQARIWLTGRYQPVWHAFNAVANLSALFALWFLLPMTMALALVLIAIGSEFARTKIALRSHE